MALNQRLRSDLVIQPGKARNGDAEVMGSLSIKVVHDIGRKGEHKNPSKRGELNPAPLSFPSEKEGDSGTAISKKV